MTEQDFFLQALKGEFILMTYNVGERDELERYLYKHGYGYQTAGGSFRALKTLIIQEPDGTKFKCEPGELIWISK